ncbi:MAG: putative toxin-antitoxin system toxin component, PIN family [Candidatus Blackburnbacteria bacterium]|nr:putative toxin-antitoxin system toxin component, PIN family [Candidatus Blackburnbacteria bacterium]
MIKVVFDTVIFVRGLINPHNFAGKVLFTKSSQYRLFVSKPVLVEILEVLQRPELTSKFKTIKNLDKTRILHLLKRAEVIEVKGDSTASRELKDNKFLALAEVAKADYLVSEDRDLLDLKEYKNTKIIDTETFLNVLSPAN